MIGRSRHLHPLQWEQDRVSEEGSYQPSHIATINGLGCRFAEVEAIVALSMLVRNYRIEVQAEQLVAGETLQERRTRILAFSDILTLTPKHIPLTFSRR